MASPADRIELRGLRTTAIVGVLPEERTRAQPVEVDLDLVVDLTEAGGSDDLAATVDYGAVCDVVAETLANGRPALLERLAELVAAAVLDVDDRVTAVTVALRKLRPPVAHQLDSAGVRITRHRAG
ncbi:MAG TPA: dihydroneopterin aldolase [Microthrixaceae bacterium]|nr:dihydroneopterin aldolase [Microthrixaceae bacterium]